MSKLINAVEDAVACLLDQNFLSEIVMCQIYITCTFITLNDLLQKLIKRILWTTIAAAFVDANDYIDQNQRTCPDCKENSEEISMIEKVGFQSRFCQCGSIISFCLLATFCFETVDVDEPGTDGDEIDKSKYDPLTGLVGRHARVSVNAVVVDSGIIVGLRLHVFVRRKQCVER